MKKYAKKSLHTGEEKKRCHARQTGTCCLFASRKIVSLQVAPLKMNRFYWLTLAASSEKCQTCKVFKHIELGLENVSPCLLTNSLLKQNSYVECHSLWGRGQYIGSLEVSFWAYILCLPLAW